MSTTTESPTDNPLSVGVNTVTTFLLICPFRVFWYLVVKLWYTPVPIPVKYKIPAVLVPIPTKVPVEPRPTLKVEIPIKSFDIFAV